MRLYFIMLLCYSKAGANKHDQQSGVNMTTTAAQKRAIEKYKKNNTKMVSFQLSLKYDKDIINHLETINNKSSYLKELIRQDINK